MNPAISNITFFWSTMLFTLWAMCTNFSVEASMTDANPEFYEAVHCRQKIDYWAKICIPCSFHKRTCVIVITGLFLWINKRTTEWEQLPCNSLANYEIELKKYFQFFELKDDKQWTLPRTLRNMCFLCANLFRGKSIMMMAVYEHAIGCSYIPLLDAA